MNTPLQKVETLRWEHDHLEMIDQRILPAEFKMIRFDSAAEVAAGIRDMVVRGAPAIGVAAAYGIALEARRFQGVNEQTFTCGLETAFKTLAESRPTAVNLFWALDRMKTLWQSQQQVDTHALAQFLLAEAQAIFNEDIQINRAIGAQGAALLKQGDRVLTHCNAGALATAGHGTALGVIRSACEAGKNITVIADETRPFLQGARLTAWEMVQENIPVTLITDNMAGFMMKSGEVDAVIVGADRVAANGDVANKIGTYMLAVLAKQHDIPFYVACPLSTFDFSMATGDVIPIEERSRHEVTGFRDCQWAAAGVKVRNPAFDVTPAELITAIITEQGVLDSPDMERLQHILTGKT